MFLYLYICVLCFCNDDFMICCMLTVSLLFTFQSIILDKCYSCKQTSLQQYSLMNSSSHDYMIKRIKNDHVKINKYAVLYLYCWNRLCATYYDLYRVVLKGSFYFSLSLTNFGSYRKMHSFQTLANFMLFMFWGS